jgi:hypothetical protein
MNRRRMAILVVVALAGTVVLEADVFVRRLAIQRTEEVLDGCVQLDEPRIDLGGYPVAVRALRGNLDDVRFTADSAAVAGIRLTDMRGHVRRVRFRVLGGADDINIQDADVSARLDQRDLEDVLDDLGLGGTVRIVDDGLQIQLDGVPATIQLDIDVEAGAVVIALDGMLSSFVGLRFDIPGVTVNRIETMPGSLYVDATANGSPRDVACIAEDVVTSRLRSLSGVAALLPGP